MYSFAGKVAWITGSSSGIGRAIALAFAEHGADVIVHGHSNIAGAKQVMEEVQRQGRRALLVQGDVANAGDVHRMTAEIEHSFGRLDILVNNAGTLLKRCKIEEMDEQLWDQVMNVNLKSAFLVTKAALPLMKRQKQGQIINVTSIAARNGGGFGAVAYATAKAGLSTLTRGLAKELKEYNIRVNGIGPGVIATAFHDRFTPEPMRQNNLQSIPLGREGQPEETAGAVLFLASDYASYITGEIIEINGGQLMD
ncbi:SDR family NAD(P)-dependent oxidoreductase [Brevibacillus fulvus]|uniref:3-oxoacyl-[acyl-carrier protein] reductase n=1 Tax=Brevibacillus fulvus TaxID=1125967 RepID=A0A938XSK6_9BACL|nr:SDR family NAD(P)-dependent oxidoreductase [Brevibacillus fulvus]MBM7589628.1 3-oxoacyl-[acyl-carrier protein] reductase [Brevibacillus fulvus]